MRAQVFEPTILWDGCDGMGPIKSISCGESHTLILLSKARQGGENVNGEKEGEAGQFEDTTAGGRKRDCVGEEGGDVFVCGRNQRGQLGIGAPSLSQLVLPPMADKGVDEVSLLTILSRGLPASCLNLSYCEHGFGILFLTQDFRRLSLESTPLFCALDGWNLCAAGCVRWLLVPKLHSQSLCSFAYRASSEWIITG
jgi:hypothetical protein